MEPKIQLVINHTHHITTYHTVDPEKGWKIDHTFRCLIVGKFPRTYIPLDNILYFSIGQVDKEQDG